VGQLGPEQQLADGAQLGGRGETRRAGRGHGASTAAATGVIGRVIDRPAAALVGTVVPHAIDGLLSGGEKALTAIALVFSLFQLNPAPFCLLDEVDAPLDDTNTERFCGLVRRMAEQTQFAFISHNKITMEIAEQLIGVTMQESGVSRVVAVDIEEALRMKEAVAA
jgi:ABC-type iron transport system FetAB ATPase subunit